MCILSHGVWWCCRAVSCAVVWCGSVTLCEAFLAYFYGFMVSSTSIALKWLCGRSGASGRVSRCRHGVGCVVSLSLCGAVALCVALWWSSLAVVVSGLAVCLWWSLWLFWCAVRGAVSLVLSCCLVSVSSLVVWCSVFWSLVVSSLVWSSGVWYIISSALNFYAHEKSAT